MVHEQQVVSRWECKLHQRIRDVFSLSNFWVFKVESQHTKILANYSNGINPGAIFLMRRHLLMFLICVCVDFIHVAERDVIASQIIVLLMWNDFLRKKNWKIPEISKSFWLHHGEELTLLELLLSFLSCSSNTMKHSRKLVMIRRPTRFWLGGDFFFLDCALIFCAM